LHIRDEPRACAERRFDLTTFQRRWSSGFSPIRGLRQKANRTAAVRSQQRRCAGRPCQSRGKRAAETGARDRGLARDVTARDITASDVTADRLAGDISTRDDKASACAARTDRDRNDAVEAASGTRRYR